MANHNAQTSIGYTFGTMATHSLQSLFEAIAQTQDERELRSQVMGRLGEHFAARRWGLIFLDVLNQMTAQQPLNKLLQRAASIDHNPVLRHLVERHSVVHEAVLLPPGVWARICPRSDHAHVMAGPIISNGQLVGVIGFTRAQDMPAFDAQNLSDLGAICLHLSTWLVSRSQPGSIAFNTDRLTAREVEIAKLVAQGLTNAEIGASLWITENSVKQALKRMFRKLEVSSRTEMVTQLASRDRFYGTMRLDQDNRL